MAGRQVYTSTEVCAISGLSYRRLNRWGVLGALAPSVRRTGRGIANAGLYSTEDLEAACVLARIAGSWPHGQVDVPLVRSVVDQVRAGSWPVVIDFAPGIRLTIERIAPDEAEPAA